MDSPSSPPVLYLGDDDDDDNISRASSSNDRRLPRKKRKLTNTNVHINSSVVNWSKRQRNDYYQQQSSQHCSDSDSEPILIDPDEYIIEEPDTHSFRSFDWTIQNQPPKSPTPPPPPVLSTKISSNPIQRSSPRVPNTPLTNVNHVGKRPIEKSHTTSVQNSNDKNIQQSRKPISMPAPRPSLAVLTLPISKPPPPPLSPIRSSTRRGRPVKNSRIPYAQSTSPPSLRQRSEQQTSPSSLRPRLEQQTSRPSTSSTTTAVITPSTEIRRQVLNGTGLLSAFHDTKYYQCNICKFKSVTSSTLLQHLFTHMFFCEQCSFYTYSHYTLSQHIFEKHSVTETIHDPANPKAYDLLYVTRCQDGTFALCMDSSSSDTTNKANNTNQQFIISSATYNDQQQNKPLKKKPLKQKELLNEDDNDIVLLTEKCNTNHRSTICLKEKEKNYQSYVLIKHRRFYSLKKPLCLHSLILEYNICREHTIRHMCQTQDILKRRKFITKFSKTRLVDEVADCLRTIVNDIINSEENNSDQTSLICALPNHILNSILSIDNLNIITDSLKLNNKYDQNIEQKQLYDHEHKLRESRENIFVVSSPETNNSEQAIISSLHSSMTNGDSVFTQTKLDKISFSNNSHRFLKTNATKQPQTNTFKSNVQKKVNTKPPPPPPPSVALLPKAPSLRPVLQKLSRPLPNPSLSTIIDRNNNSVPSTTTSKLSPTKTPSAVIVLD
ncbi:unnamed protein product [Adineta steineri]|uniref:C2H2-type domain-containing protein n=2 Tax=Adineta steineri TaxID=433720 RepID=A0A819KQL7_9BILA|nr:unnamed protein product [Adineta steineri]